MSDEETNKAAVRRYFEEVYVRGNVRAVRAGLSARWSRRE